MSVIIKSVGKGCPAYKAGIKSGDTLISIDGNEIVDVLDYRFYQDNERLTVEFIDSVGKRKTAKIKKDEYEELGLEFETYLMDNKHSCRNNCVFCFIDQLPKGLRESLYFKDDDSRLSFLFGNYITLTNITEHEVERIIKMHISPINISVHTTNPELRVKMMTNKNAGNVLEIIDRFNDAGIKLNCQLVLCPGYNDGEELERTLGDLSKLQNAECIAAVPVGLTAYREGLAQIEPFNKKTAGDVLRIIDKYGDICLEKYGQRRIYGADEFYLLAEREIPEADYYGDFLQLENGVGLWSLLRSEALGALEDCNYTLKSERKVSLASGEAAYPLIKMIADRCTEKNPLLKPQVYAVKNNFFGGKINVSGLVTATDIEKQLKGADLGEELLIPSVMLRAEGDMFLDSVTVDELSERLNIKITPVNNDGYELVNAIFGIKE
ncbi:MAG: DUF512 domain-containing protein [Acutalibacteraceae bacterium]|nr:DUF512 domain-containing protein [Acutalibacteraceae bacterium]